MDSARVVNRMRTMKCGRVMNLKRLHQDLGGVLYSGRPQMLVFPTSVGRNMQVFRNGTVQILGDVSDELARIMCHEFEEKTCERLPPMTISNLVMSARLTSPDHPCLTRFRYSDANVFYETEIFPAALIRTWRPIHVALFHNGHVILTGVRSFREGRRILRRLQKML